MKISINNKDIELKSKMRAYLIYETLTGKVFEPKNMTDMVIYFYSLILANYKNFKMTFSEFIDYLDDNPTLFTDFNNWLIDENKVLEQFNDKKKEGNENPS